MHEERLRQLRRVVAEVPEESLFMGSFSRYMGCGTVYCAAGHAALDEWFVQRTPIREIFEVFTGLWGERVIPRSIDPFTPLGQLFGISREDSGKIFGEGLTYNQDVPRRWVLDNIDRVLNGQEAEWYEVEEEEFDG